MSARREPYPTKPALERAILVGLDLGRSRIPVEESLDELARLAETDGAEVVGRMTQRLASPVSATFVGSGKAREIVEEVRLLSADVVIFDDELTPSQQSNLEKIIGEPTKVIDRTALILDIFGNHAKTREGRLQVQLAQLQYLLPRLRGMWSHLVGEQTRGGIGSRFGQGESQLEVDRRLVRSRISTLKRELDRLELQRDTRAKARLQSGVWRVALAGYTNAGKSTLLNALAASDVYAKDELFATLDPTTRSVELDDGRHVTITDTVGFIQKLPTTLVEAFKSTLAEVRTSDLILKVVDASDENMPFELEVVDDILAQIGAGDIPSVTVANKCDLLTDEQARSLSQKYPGAQLISALGGEGLDGLRWRIASEAARGDQLVTALIPYERGSLISLVHERGQVVREKYGAEGLMVTARVPGQVASALEGLEV